MDAGNALFGTPAPRYSRLLMAACPAHIRAAPSHAARVLMALLWLAASLAYLTREQALPVGPGALSVSQMSGLMSLTAPSDHPDNNHLDSMEMPGEGAPAAVPEHPGSIPDQGVQHHQTHSANAPPLPSGSHQHAGHCPFCGAAAFALGAGVVPATLPLTSSLPVRRVLRLSAPTPLAAVHDARAPPFPA
jgi:hypothetical protein